MTTVPPSATVARLTGTPLTYVMRASTEVKVGLGAAYGEIATQNSGRPGFDLRNDEFGPYTSKAMGGLDWRGGGGPSGSESGCGSGSGSGPMDSVGSSTDGAGACASSALNPGKSKSPAQQATSFKAKLQEA